MNKNFFVICFIAPHILLAQELLAQEENNSAIGWLDFILNNAVGLSILFVFISALFGFFIKARSIDKCLKDFSLYSITLEMIDGSIYKGIMNIYYTGIELTYKKVKQDIYTKYSRILYASEYPTIKKIYRYQNELSEENRKKREKSIKRTYKPGLIRKVTRKIKNILGTFRDALTESFSIILGQLKKNRPGSKVLTQDKHLKTISQEMVEHSGNVYDPILEKYIGRHVIIETIDKEEIFGIFKEYSQNYLEILNVPNYTKYSYPIQSSQKKSTQSTQQKININISKSKKKITIKNLESYPVCISKIGNEEQMEQINKLIETQQEIILDNQLLSTNKNEILLEFITPTDIIIPRTTAFIRFCGDERKLTWKEALQMDFESIWAVTKLNKIDKIIDKK